MIDFVFSLISENKYMPPEFREEMYHYTSPSGFLSILTEKKDSMQLWASRFDCLNDLSEGQIVNSAYREACSRLNKDGIISLQWYNLLCNIKPRDTVAIYPSIGDVIEIRWEKVDRFITSFSRNPDSLSMWNYYSKGDKYEGFNIGVSSLEMNDFFKRHFSSTGINITIYPVIYEQKKQVDLIYSFLKEALSYYEEGEEGAFELCVSEQLTEWSLIFKSDFFRHEEEVRVIVDVPKDIDLIKEEFPTIKYRDTHGYIVPYIQLEIDKGAVFKVMIGPLQCADGQKEQQKKVLKEMLISNGYTVDIDYSKIPIRY